MAVQCSSKSQDESQSPGEPQGPPFSHSFLFFIKKIATQNGIYDPFWGKVGGGGRQC